MPVFQIVELGVLSVISVSRLLEKSKKVRRDRESLLKVNQNTAKTLQQALSRSQNEVTEAD